MRSGEERTTTTRAATARTAIQASQTIGVTVCNGLPEPIASSQWSMEMGHQGDACGQNPSTRPGMSRPTDRAIPVTARWLRKKVLVARQRTMSRSAIAAPPSSGQTIDSTEGDSP
jgi:hypothetical protein